MKVRGKLPTLRIPVSLIVDDWTVGYIGESGKLEFKRTYEFLLDFLSLGAMGVRGKLSLVPCIVKSRECSYELLGCIDKGIEGLPRNVLLKILNLVKVKAIKYFDITPEMLTHTLAIDVDANRLLDEMEWEWSQRQDLETLTRYIARALSILRRVGIKASGVTSPCDFGREVEGIYARAVLEAEKRVNGIKLTWYFLHVEDGKKRVTPRLMYLEEEKEEAVVSIVSCSKDYLGKPKVAKAGGDPYRLADNWITSDGRKGRLVELYKNRAYLIFHTHWWNVHREEDKIGFEALKETVSRINRLLGDGIIWMKCSEIARYFATLKAFKFEEFKKSGGVKLVFKTPFNCKNFTISLETDRHIKEMKANGKPLKRINKQFLEPNSWTEADEKVYACFDLSNGTILELAF